MELAVPFVLMSKSRRRPASLLVEIPGVVADAALEFERSTMIDSLENW